MSAASGCSGPTTVTPQPSTTSLKSVDKNPPPPTAPTIVLAPSPITNNNVNSTSTTNSIVVGDLLNSTSTSKGEVSTNSVHQNNVQHQPIDLAQNATTSSSQQILRTTGSSPLLQLHPISTIRTSTTAGKGTPVVLTNTTNVANHTSGTITHQPASIISVSRTGSNLTILPTRVPFQASNGSTALQFPRGTTFIRPAGTLNTTCPPGSITVTPISGSSIRLASATVNNGSWLQTSNNSHCATFTPIRPIQMTGRAIRPDAKVIHIPSPGTVQHLAQLQVLDGKGGTAIIKPHLSGTPIIRTIQTSNTSVSGSPITPSFTIRTASLPNSRPSSTTPTLQKVITQPTHGPSIQLVGGSKLSPHSIQTITPIPRLTLSNPVCLTLSTNGPVNSTNTTPVVAVASKGGGGHANIIMGSNAGNPVPLTKIYDVPLLNILAKGQTQLTNSTGSVTISVSSTLPNNTSNAQNTTATNSPMQSTTNTGTHHVVQIHGPLNGPGQPGNPNIATIGLAQSSTTSNFFVGQKGVSFVQAGTTIPIRPLTIDKKQDIRPNTPTSKGNSATSGQLILTPSPNPPSSSTGPVAISIGPHTFAHPITIASTTQQTGIITTSPAGTSTTSIVPTIPSSGFGTANTSVVNVVGGQQQTLTLSGHIIATPHSSQNVQLAIPSHLSSSLPPSPSSTPSFTSAVSSTTSVIVTTASAGSNSSLSTTSIPSVPITSPSIIVSNPTSGANTSGAVTAAPSPGQQTASQSKTNLSPRPSILRKRDAATSDNIQSRAQRNLALNFTLPSPNANTLNIPTNSSSVSATISATVAAANKENNAANTICLSGNNSSNNGLGLVKKDFQPPNEESSWQSCSSNSSSGSTTLSTTSETAEIQLQQSLGVTIANLTNVSTTSIYNVSNGVSTTASMPPTIPTPTFSSTTLNTQNGSYRATNTPSGRSRLTSTSKALNKDLDRVKGVKGKDDHVSPRKKPRKQQLPTGDPLEPASSEISFYHGKRLKKNELLDPSLFQGFPDKVISETNRDEGPSPRVCYVLKRPHYSLLESDRLTVRSRLNHFQKYTDVKPKDEKRPSLNELANQKDVFTKINGWKFQHLNNHLEQVIQSETNVVSDFKSLLEKIDAKTGPDANIRDLNRLQELLKGNIQRCKVITDQMSEAQSQVNKILGHKANIGDILSKYVNKRPTKKRERL